MAAILRRSFLLFLLLGAAFAAHKSKPTALDRYVQKPDSSYKYELAKTIPGQGFTTYVLNLTSQTWRSEKDVNRPLWKHWLIVVKPDQVKHSTAMLFISGGSNGGNAPAGPDAFMRQIALDTDSVTAELKQVPNEPLTFAGETKGRTEDSAIVYTWDKYLRGGDEEWPMRLPMTKAAVRAMDSVQTFLADPARGGVKIEKFVVSGGSKRGWTTWTTAAVDPRVAAIIPAVIDVLNMLPSMQNHWRSYGFWAPAVGDYQKGRIFDWMNTKRLRDLMTIEEPYQYRDRLTMPKYIVNAGGDQFFLPDSWKYYWKDLKGEKYLRYVPNADHSLRGSDAMQTITAFYDAFLNGRARPRFDWRVEKNGDIRITVKDQPKEVKLWVAANPNGRDFRVEKLGKAYQASALAETRPGVYVAHVDKPEKGYKAFFAELTYQDGKYPLKFTSGIVVTPETYPAPSYQPDPATVPAGTK